MTLLLTECVSQVISDLINIGSRFLGEGAPELSSLTKFRAVAHEVWYKAYDNLQRLESEKNRSNTFRDLLRRTTDRWMDFGQALRIQEPIRVGRWLSCKPCRWENCPCGDPKGRLARYPWTPWKPCHWSECMCGKVKPRHPMQVCTKCWSVFYCNKRCQKKSVTAFHVRLRIH